MMMLKAAIRRAISFASCLRSCDRRSIVALFSKSIACELCMISFGVLKRPDSFLIPFRLHRPLFSLLKIVSFRPDKTNGKLSIYFCQENNPLPIYFFDNYFTAAKQDRFQRD